MAEAQAAKKESDASSPAADTRADKPVPKLVPDRAAEKSTDKVKRRGRPPSNAGSKAPKKVTKKKGPEILFLVETDTDSGLFELQNVVSTTELMDLIDEQRRVLVTRDWREF